MLKMSKANIFKCVFVFLLLIILGLFVLYYFKIRNVMFVMEYEEVLRVRSPDNKVDAVLMEGDAGAMSSFSYYLYVLPAGDKISEKDIRKDKYQPVFAAIKMKGESITWLMDNVLEIKYTKAKIFAFRNNTWPLSDDTHYEVEIRETPLTGPPSLP